MRARIKAGALLCALAVFGVTAAGCGDGGPELGQVTGKVTYQNAPLADAEIEFQPVDKRSPSSARTNAEGVYTLKYTATKDGALIGEHIVRVRTAKDATDDGQAAVPEKLPAKHHSKSEIKKTVQSGSQTIDIPLD